MVSLFFTSRLSYPWFRIPPLRPLLTVPPLPISFASSPGDSAPSVLLLVFCTMIEMRRFDGSSGSFALRRRWSAKPALARPDHRPIPIAASVAAPLSPGRPRVPSCCSCPCLYKVWRQAPEGRHSSAQCVSHNVCRVPGIPLWISAWSEQDFRPVAAECFKDGIQPHKRQPKLLGLEIDVLHTMAECGRFLDGSFRVADNPEVMWSCQ